MLNNDFIPIIKKSKLIVSVFNEKYIYKIWYLSAIENIDTQVARRGRQYHRNPPPYKNRHTKRTVSTKKIKVSKTHHHTTQPTQPPPPSQTQPNTNTTTTTTTITRSTPNPTPPKPNPNPTHSER